MNRNRLKLVYALNSTCATSLSDLTCIVPKAKKYQMFSEHCYVINSSIINIYTLKEQELIARY